MLDTQLPPINPTPEEEELCKKADEFFGNHFGQTRHAPSGLIKGALYAMRPECRSNDDWRSQSANSLREVIYPLISPNIKRANPIKLFKQYATDNNHKQKITNKDFVKTFDILTKVYGKLNDLTHHGIEPKTLTAEEYDKFGDKGFEELVSEFKNVLLKIFTLQQIFMHGIIDAMVHRKRKTQQLNDDLKLILQFNVDAKNYFFTKANERWLDWLWRNGFLDAIKQKSEDPTSYRYSLPELNYLDRVAKEVPAKVVEIMLDIDVAKNFNPEVVDRFARICGELPAAQLKKIIPKIAKENWIKLMSRYGGHHGFEYKSMLNTLDEAKDYKSLLTLSKAILSTKGKNDMDDSDRYNKNPFCLGDLSYSEVFNHIVKVDDNHAKEALAQTVEALSKALSIMDNDEFYFMEDNVFTLELQDREGLSPRNGIRNLVAVIKILANRVADNDVKYVLNTVLKLEDGSAIARRLKLYVATLKPADSKKEIKELLFYVFDADDPARITMGAEYDTVLQKCFSILSVKDRQEYVDKAIDLPKQCNTEKERERYAHIASGLFPNIAEALTKTQKKQIEYAGYTIGEKTEPRPTMSEVTGGTVVSRGPITQEEFDKFSVKDIASKLRDDWSPAELEKQNTPQDFLNPRDAEGVGNLIKDSMTRRLQEFINNADLFCGDDINRHYTYSLLRGIEEIIKNDFDKASKTNWGQLINLLEKISDPGQQNERHDGGSSHRRWLASRDSVLTVASSVLESMLRKQNDMSVINFGTYRNQLLSIISNLLSYQDPAPKDEDYRTAKMTTSSAETGKLVSSPFSMAINSVRGSAFQAFILFVYRDGDPLKVDVKKLYEKTINNENTKAIYFMFGHYLSTFYYGDKRWLVGLLPKIFPGNNQQLYLAAWEGYISANLFEEIFGESEIQKLYKIGLTLTKKIDPKREFFRDPEQGIAVHVALAYIHYENFDEDNELFKKFWNDGTETQHAEFIDFIGRKYLSKKQGSKITKAMIKQLESLWDFILNNCKHEGSLTDFGSWINVERDVFDAQWLAVKVNETLDKTGGALDWDYGLKKSIVKLAEASPKDALGIIRKHLLDYGVNMKGEHRPIFFETEWGNALKITYKNSDTKEGAVTLIDALVRDGGSQFWPLKEII